MKKSGQCTTLFLACKERYVAALRVAASLLVCGQYDKKITPRVFVAHKNVFQHPFHFTYSINLAYDSYIVYSHFFFFFTFTIASL